ncbi:MAG: hypothetical protein ACXWNK_11900 [Vulcanimicrobiaceae bacterium]
MSTPLEDFRAAVDSSIGNHPIVCGNRYTAWFARGEATLDELRRFTVQFSVFSHLFVEAQLRKVINAPDIRSYRAGKEILMNELGVTFTQEGSVENGRFTFRAGHFEWLAEFAAALDLRFEEIGKRGLGTETTLAFCDALMEWYGSADPSTAAGASYAIEHWAAAGFWKELIAGLRRIKEERIADLPLGFWTWHDRLEDQHAAHTDDELALEFARPGFSQERFLEAGAAILGAVATFWDGLNAERPEPLLI